MSFYIYILFSKSSNLYYVGHSENVEKRLYEHNHPISKKFTSKHLPWELKKSFEVGATRSLALCAEKYIKKQKSRKYIERLINDVSEQQRIIHMVGVPMHRD